MMNYRFLTLLIIAQLLVACSGESDSTSAAVEAADSAETMASSEASADAPKQAEKAASGAKTKAKKEPGAGPMPPKFAEIQEILKAASLTSEPGNMVYNAHSEPTVALRWFARYGASDHERVFALRALGLYPTPKNASTLSEVAMNDSEPTAVRAGAIRGLGRYDLESVDYEKIKAFIFETVAGKDIDLASAAADAMHGMPTAREVLLGLVAGAATPAPLKAAAERALGPQVE